MSLMQKLYNKLKTTKVKITAKVQAPVSQNDNNVKSNKNMPDKRSLGPLDRQTEVNNELWLNGQGG